jgi:hypothetical protein
MLFEAGRFTFLTLRQEDADAWPGILLGQRGARMASLRLQVARRTAKKVNAAADRDDAARYEEFRRRYVYSAEERAAILGLPTYERYYADDKGRPRTAR